MIKDLCFRIEYYNQEERKRIGIVKFETVVACVGQKRDPTYRSPTLRRRRCSREETWPRGLC